MAIRPDNTLITTREMLIELVTKPLLVIENALAALGTSHARAQALKAVAAIPESKLQANGMTRAEAVSMAFRHDA
mgnify:CR=1 FL=1